MIADVSAVAELLQLIQKEYQEHPTLNLTKRQMQRLWNLDAVACDLVIDVLVRAHVLRPSEHGGYVADGASRQPEYSSTCSNR